MKLAKATTAGRSRRPVYGAVRCAVATLCLLTLAGSVADAQTSETEGLKRQVEELNAENAALKQEVAELRATLKRLMTPPSSGRDGSQAVAISIAGLAARGQPTAPVTIVVFADYQDPQCARYYQEIHPRVDEDYLQHGTVRYVFKNLPNQKVHPQALKAHEAAACAGDQGKYWEMHDLLFANQTALATDRLLGYAQTLDLDPDLFRYCLTSGAQVATIRRDVDEGQKGGVTLTPVFAIGLTEPGAESIKVLRVVAGVQPYPVFEDAIGAVLAAAKNDQ